LRANIATQFPELTRTDVMQYFTGRGSSISCLFRESLVTTAWRVLWLRMEETQIADKGWYYSLGVGIRLTNSHYKK
jgi:hypothetical protein